MIDVQVRDVRTRVLAHVASHRIHIGPVTGPCVLHSCDRPICVQPAHLRSGSKADNTADMLRRGRAAFGERSGQTHLTESDILWLRRHEVSHAQAAKVLGISKSQVKRIRWGKNWRHLLPEKEES